MISDIGVDKSQHNHGDLHIYGLGLSEHGREGMDWINTDKERKTPHLGSHTESLSLVSICHSVLLSVIS